MSSEGQAVNPPSTLDWVLEAVFLPSTSDHLGVFYLVWVCLFMSAHLIWDIRTSQTPPFHLKRLEQKFGVLFSAASFASSIIIVLSLVSESVRLLFSDNILPLVLAALSGVLQSVPALCPYDIKSSTDGSS